MILLQRLMAREAEQQRADEVLLRSCAPADLMQVPLWANSLVAGQAGQLQGTLTIPTACSVRLARRLFARAVQVSQFSMDGVAKGGSHSVMLQATELT